jgi:hypothetical protein
MLFATKENKAPLYNPLIPSYLRIVLNALIELFL